MVIPPNSNLQHAGDVKKFTDNDLNKMKKEELMTALNTLIEANRGETITLSSSAIEGKLDDLLKEFRDFKDNYKRLDSELTFLKRENANLKEAVMQHQRYLESIESEKRARNLIFLGIPEGDMTFTNNDGEAVVVKEDANKIREILKKIHREDTQVEDLRRLGKPSTGRNRVVLAKLQSKEARDHILQSAPTLKSLGSGFEKIFLKKDVHPLVRKEFNRLREVERREKDKPENQGFTVTYDSGRREVIVNGRVVDYFRPSFFI